MAAPTELVFQETVLGNLLVSYRRKTTLTADDIVESQTKALLFSMRMELRRRQLANGNNDLGEITYFVGRL